MKNSVKQLDSRDITSDIFIISPAQVEYIAQIFTKNFADSMADIFSILAKSNKLILISAIMKGFLLKTNIIQPFLNVY